MNLEKYLTEVETGEMFNKKEYDKLGELKKEIAVAARKIDSIKISRKEKNKIKNTIAAAILSIGDLMRNMDRIRKA